MFLAVLAARREHDRQFAGLLADVTYRDVLPAGLLPVERVLVELVQPLAVLRHTGTAHRDRRDEASAPQP